MHNMKIKIPENAIESTQQKCASELNQIRTKEECSPFVTLLAFLKQECKNYFLLLIIGAVLLGLASLWNNSPLFFFSLITYFLILGCVSIYESCKSRLYHMEELLQATLIRPQKALVYKTVCITLLETLMFFVMMACFHNNLAYGYYEMFSYTLLPILLSQVLSLALIQHGGNIIFETILTMGAYAAITMAFLTVDITKYIHATMMICPLIILVLLYILLLNNIYHKEQGGDLSWN